MSLPGVGTCHPLLGFALRGGDTGSVQTKPGLICPRATTSKEDHHLFIILKRNRDASVSQISRKLYAATGALVSRMTVSRRLHEGGLFARKIVVSLSVLRTGEPI
ncbi:HTH_Tnp_Tc3_2 domain-containing protein [Trichonephila clavipes]|nr:HTH_Tnp_Tc3_2 domain-containing protein [Trichonephila clavipes]